MSHVPQQNYPKQTVPGMFDPRSAAPANGNQPATYSNGIPPNRMMDRMEVPQQNAENVNKDYYAYNQRSQALDSTWMRNQENHY